MSLRPGARVRQADYGDGEIVLVTAQHVTVAFDDGSVRKFVTSMAVLEPSTTPVPQRLMPARSAAPKRARR
ncbi:MAG: hypothetical protein AB7U83_16505 [Vicinamibacterales bacterium]